MSDDRSQPERTIEQLVTDMLTRRAADIPDSPEGVVRIPPAVPPAANAPHTTQPWPHTDRRRWLAGAAGLLLLSGGLLALAQRDGQRGEADPENRIEAGVDDGQDSSTDESQGEATDSGPGRDVADDPAVNEVVALLPDGFDVLSASMVELRQEPTTDPALVAEDYLTDRLPDLAVAIRPAGDDGPLHLFRWSVGGDGFPDRNAPEGWVMVRVDPDRAGVVAAITDGVDLAELARTDGRLTASATHDLSADLYADVTDLHGQPVTSGAEGVPFGTAGSTAGTNRLELAVEVPPWPVALQLRQVGGTVVSITEVVADPRGFASSCGPTPPVEIDVGSRLGTIEPGPVDDRSRPSVTNQGVWHHAATEASKQTAIEIRWPPDPGLVGRFDHASLNRDLIATFATGTPLGVSAATGQPLSSENHALIALGGDGATDPCDLVQLSVLGDPETAGWWAGALRGQWSFDLPLTVATADLDPLVDPDGAGGSFPEASQELIVGVREGIDPADIPRVPQVGSCDGLPDDPPRTGAVPGTVLPTADQALADFVATIGTIEDPPLATTGYVEYRTAGRSARSYVIEYGSEALTVIDVEEAEGGWRVANWEASVC